MNSIFVSLLLAVGQYHTCAAVSGAVKCWGLGEQGQLGDGQMKSSQKPVAVQGLTDVAALSAGLHWTCALLKNGKVDCWGSTDARWAADTAKKGVVTKCWEELRFKKKGVPGFDCASKPIEIAGLSAKSLLVQASYACATKTDDNVTCYVASKETSKKISVDFPELKGASQVISQGVDFNTTGRGQGCGLVAGELRCWGSVNEVVKVKDFAPIPGMGKLNTMTMHQVGGLVYGQRTDQKVILLGGGLMPDSAPKSLGDNKGGTVGVETPTLVPELEGMIKISEAHFYGCGLYASGEVKCWGDSGDVGKLGDGRMKAVSRTPVAVKGIKDAVDIGVAKAFACAALKSNKVMCWGKDYGATPKEVKL